MFGELSFIRLDSADSLVTLRASGSAPIAKPNRMDDLAVNVQFECYFHVFDDYDGYSCCNCFRRCCFLAPKALSASPS